MIKKLAFNEICVRKSNIWTTDKSGRQRQINIIMAVETVEDKKSVTNYFV